MADDITLQITAEIKSDKGGDSKIEVSSIRRFVDKWNAVALSHGLPQLKMDGDDFDDPAAAT
jgi:hypothetical protein